MQPKSQFSLGNLAHKASTLRSLAAQIEEINYSSQAMYPKNRFSSGNLAHKASAPRSPTAQFDELNYSTKAMQPKSQFSSGTIAYKASPPKRLSSSVCRALQLRKPSAPTEPQQLSLTSSTTLLRHATQESAQLRHYSP